MLEMIAIGYDLDASPRMLHGVRLLREALEACDYMVEEKAGGWAWNRYRDTGNRKIYVGRRTGSELLAELEARDVLLYHTDEPTGEGFYLASCPGRLVVVSGGNDSGALYGCQELAVRIREEGGLPRELSFGDTPRLDWRGPAIGMQKQHVEPGRQPFEYPLTPDRFPWFYDRVMWLDYLDMLLEHRGNSLYLWNANPFASLIDLPGEPEAREVTKDQLEENASLLHWLTEEADRRGIQCFLAFYSIHIPQGFADKHGLSYKQLKPLPETSDYFRRLLTAFVRAFPSVGLMVCLGEKLKGQMYGAEWLCETILPGIMEGFGQSAAAEPPPVVVRSHAIDIEKVMQEADGLYPNLHSEMKFNGESLTTWTPRGGAQGLHRRLAERDGKHLVTVHMNANLEPFRWGAPSFIQRCVQAARYRLKASALQIFPLSYWSWPYSPDRSEHPIKQVDRDWIWFEAWLRYAWNSDRDGKAEKSHWIARLEEKYGSRQSAEHLLHAYETIGTCAPKLLRRFGITQGNRQTMSLGMTMSQLTNPERHVPWSELWESHAPQGERLEEFVLKQLAGMPHLGETPLDIVEEVERASEEASKAAKQARMTVKKNKAEFERLAADIDAIKAMTNTYTYKVRAALLVFMYKHTAFGKYAERVSLLEEAAEWLDKSVAAYRKLTETTEKHYGFANGMQTAHRKIPFREGEFINHWRDCLPLFERELAVFRQRIGELRAGKMPASLNQAPSVSYRRYRQASFTLLSEDAELYRIEKGARVFTDGDIPIISCAEELYGLTGIRYSQLRAAHEEIRLDVELKEPSLILVGCFNSRDDQWMKPGGVAAVDQYTFGLDPVIRRGIRLFVYPSVHVHALPYEAGRHTLRFGKGAFLILGVIELHQNLSDREFDPQNEERTLLDWLYEMKEVEMVQ